MKALNEMEQHKIIAIIRGYEEEDAYAIAKALYDGGIRLVEVTLNSPNALRTIERISKELGDKMLVGAGTVLDPESAQAALLAGAKFILSPSLNTETIKLTKRYGAVSIPGAYSPTEILTAYEAGADVVKVFPATTLGPSYIKDLNGPLPQLRLLPTGGVALDNVESYLSVGAFGVGLGSSLVHKTKEVTEAYLEEITNKARQFTSLVTDATGGHLS